MDLVYFLINTVGAGSAAEMIMGGTMKVITKAAVLGSIAAATLGIPAVSAQAASTGSGASVVAQVNGVTTHSACIGDDVVLVASGFAPGRRQVQFRVVQVGSDTNPLFTGSIPVSGGSGSYDTGSTEGAQPGKYRVRYQTGSTDHAGNYGSWSLTLTYCS